MEGLKLAKSNLRPSAFLDVEKLPCREKEFDIIYDFILDQYTSQSGGCYYLAGVPGTGKTATVRKVIKAIEDNAKSLRIRKNSIIFVEVNGLKLTDAYQFYSHIYHEIYGQRKSAKKAEEYLHDRFCSPSEEDKFVVLVVDELDSLQTSKQDILYHVFDWPHRPNSKLAVIAIANTLNLPERIFEKRVHSRIGHNRLDFQPYKFTELEKIIAARIAGINVSIDKKGIQYISRKVASISGDARKVMDICRRAIEIAEEQFFGKSGKNGKVAVVMDHFLKAVGETTSAPKIIYMRKASDLEKNLLLAISKHFQISGTEEGQCDEIFHYWSDLCSADSLMVNFSEFLEVAYSLHESRLIILEPGKVDVKRRIRLVVSTDDIAFALKKAKDSE